MRYFLYFCLLLSSLSVFAREQPIHMFTVGRNGFGWGGAYEKMGTKEKSPFDEVKYILSDIALNYAFRLGHRWQLGAFYQTNNSEYSFEKVGTNAFTQITSTNYGLFTLYNFSDDFYSAYFLGASFSFVTYEEENSINFTESEGKAPFELDDYGAIYELNFGKRFSLKKWDISHLTYAPTVSVFYRTHGRDFNDQLIGDGLGVAWQVVKFDFLF